MSLNISGLVEYQARLQRIKTSVMGKMGVALFKEAVKIKNEAVKRTPYDTHALQNSAAVDDPINTMNHVSVTIRFGGPTAPYAVYVHENLDAHHPHGEVKFLERACMDHTSEMKETIEHGIVKLFYDR